MPELSPEQLETELLPRLNRMFQIMSEEGGIGLAAPQVGWSVRVFVTQIPVGQAEGEQEELGVAVAAGDDEEVGGELGDSVVVGAAEEVEVGEGEFADAVGELLEHRVQLGTQR